MTEELAVPRTPDWETNEWDARHKVAITTASSFDDFPDPLSGSHRIILRPEDQQKLPLDVLYVPEDSKTLLVVLHGALNRRKFELPRFEWFSTLHTVRAAKLFLSDTTLSQRADMELGWYLGRLEDDLTARYVQVVEQVRDRGGYERVMFIGSSGGGFAALAMSRQVAGSSAVAFSPQTTIAGYYSSHRKLLSRVLSGGTLSFEKLSRELGPRINLRMLYAATEDNNYFRYIQNTGDLFHYEAHYVPFALSLGVDPEAGGRTASGRGLLIPEKYDNGHVPPPRARFRKHLASAHEDFYSLELPVE